jgi:hypothetical protein
MNFFSDIFFEIFDDSNILQDRGASNPVVRSHLFMFHWMNPKYVLRGKSEIFFLCPLPKHKKMSLLITEPKRQKHCSTMVNKLNNNAKFGRIFVYTQRLEVQQAKKLFNKMLFEP